MRKTIIYILFALILPAAGFGELTHVGPLAGYGTSVKEPGFGILGIYRVNDQIKLAPNALYYLPHEISTQDGMNKFEWWMINLDGNYVLIRQGLLEGYGLMGLNFSSIKGERDEVVLGQPYKDKRTITKLGLNAGAGLRMNVADRVVPFAELRFTLGSKAFFPDYSTDEVSLSQFSLYAGVLIRISEDKDRTATEDF